MNLKTFHFGANICSSYRKISRKILKYSGYKVINTKYIQRYNFINHLGWFLREKPQGHIFLKIFTMKNQQKIRIIYLK